VNWGFDRKWSRTFQVILTIFACKTTGKTSKIENWAGRCPNTSQMRHILSQVARVPCFFKHVTLWPYFIDTKCFSYLRTTLPSWYFNSTHKAPHNFNFGRLQISGVLQTSLLLHTFLVYLSVLPTVILWNV